MRQAVIGVLLGLFAAQTWATDYYAAPGGGAAASCVDTGANVCTVARCISVATTGDRCILTEGTYPGSELGASGYVIQTSELVDLVCSGDIGTCIFQPAGTNISGVRLNSPTAAGTINLTRLTIDGAGTTPLDQCFWYSDATGHYTVNSTDNECKEAAIYGHRIVGNEVTLNSLRDTLTASTAVSPNALAQTASASWAEGAVNISGANVTIDRYDGSATPVVLVDASDAGESGSVTDSTFTIANDPATTAGFIDVIRAINVPGFTATGNMITVTGANVGATGTNCSAVVCRQVRAIKSYSDAALTSANANLSGNIITIEAASGIGVSVGDDGSGTGDTYSEYGTASRNTITCVNGGTSTHGIGLFWSQGGQAFSNWVKGCGIGLLSKGQPTAGGTYSGNILIDIWESYLYSKGSAAPKYVHNTLAVTNSVGTPVNIGVDGAIDSTNVTLDNNNIFSAGGQPTNLLTTASSQTLLEATNNNWYGFTVPQWTYLGVAYTSLANWNAVGVVGTDISTDPELVGGTDPTAPEDLKPRGDSPLCGAGKRILPRVVDHRNTSFEIPPAIGAYECGGGMPAPPRQARTY
jgi:hypothetical protein